MSFNDVFISYGRKESKHFARKLHDKLVEEGYNVWFDQEDIPLGVDFQDQIDDGITNSHNFLYIIAPHAIDSPYCRKEIELAVHYNKRILPILHVPPKSKEQENSMHPAIRRINWTPFTAAENFEADFKSLISVLTKHEHFINRHSEFLVKALTWKKNSFDSAFLLVGEDRKEAEKWMKTDFGNELPPCTPTDLHCEFIAESKKNANNLHTDVYLCYPENDLTKAQGLRLSLTRKGITTWSAEKDLKPGIKAKTQIENGIELADNFVFFVSEQSVADEELQQELDYAFALNKRVVPIKTGDFSRKNFPKELKELNLLIWRGEQQLDELLAEIRMEQEYFQQHTNILVAALKWQRQSYNQSILYRGYNLQEAENWLRIALKRNQNEPTDLQQKFVEESSQKGGSLPSEVFISYSRANADFARLLNAELQIHGKTTWFDQESIAPSADFQAEIFNGIKISDNIVFVISYRSIRSPYCEAEIEYARKLNKRFITVLFEKIDDTLIPDALRDIQWIDFRPGVRDFHTAFSELLRALDTDRDHVSAHTRWSQAAEKWNESARLEELLLRGVEFEMANAWLTAALQENKSPAPSPIQLDFIDASKHALLLAENRKKKATRRLWVMTFLMAILAIAAFVLAGWSFMLKNDADSSRQVAEERRIEAEEASKEAERQRREAEMAGKQALHNFELAEKERKNAERALKQAEESERYANLKAHEAEVNLEKAKEKTEEAKQNLQKAKDEEQKAKENAELARERMKESQANSFIAKAREVENTNPTLAMHLCLAAEKVLPQSDEVAKTISSIYYQNNFYHSFSELDSEISSVSYAPNGNFIAVVTQNNQVQIWSTFGQKIKTLWGHTSRISSMEWSPNSDYIVTGSDDKKVRLWNVKTGEGKEMAEVREPISAVSFSKKNDVIAVASGKTVQMFTTGGLRLPFFAKHKEPILAMRFSPNGKYILTGSADKTAILWRMSGRKEEILKGHHGAVSSVAFSNDGKLIATGSDDRDIIIWNYEGQAQSLLSGHELSINDIAFSYDSKHIISASKDKTARLWDITGEELQVFKGHKEEVTSVAFSPDEDVILTGSIDRSLKIWLVDTEEQKVLKSVTKNISAFAVSEHGGYIAVSVSGKEFFLLDENAVTIRAFKGKKTPISTLTFSPGGIDLISGDESGLVCVWSLEGKQKAEFKVGNSGVSLLCADPFGEYILVATRDGNLTLWDYRGNEKATFKGHTQMVTDADFSSDGNYIITTSKDGTARVWTKFGKQKSLLENQYGGATACAFSQFGTDFFVGYANGLIRLWDIRKNSIRLFGGHENQVNSIVVAPDNLTIASASDDRTARLWDMQGNELQFYTGHKDAVFDAVFDSKGKSLITASKDNTIRQWDKSFSYEEYRDAYGFGKMKIEDQLEFGLITFDELKKSDNSNDLIEGANYYLAKAVTYDEDENLRFRQNSVILLSRAVRLDSANVALKQRLANAYYDLSWDFLLREDFKKALTSAKIANNTTPQQKHLIVRLATAQLYERNWNEAEALYTKWKVKYRKAFLDEILKLESNGVYTKYREQAKKIISE